MKYWIIENKKQSIYSLLCISEWVSGAAEGYGLDEVRRKEAFSAFVRIFFLLLLFFFYLFFSFLSIT
jgi:hypothetical protein